MAIRTFLALDLDEGTRGRIASACGEIDSAGAKVRWVERENLHVTLKFLGDVGDEDLDAVCRRVAQAAGEVEPFDFDVRGIAAVPSGGPVRMFWVGVEDATGLMAELHEKLDAVLAELGFRPENRAFKPHVTLGRVKFAPDPAALRRSAAALADRDFGLQSADAVTVYSSELTPKGPIYARLATADLGR